MAVVNGAIICGRHGSASSGTIDRYLSKVYIFHAGISGNLTKHTAAIHPADGMVAAIKRCGIYKAVRPVFRQGCIRRQGNIGFPDGFGKCSAGFVCNLLQGVNQRSQAVFTRNDGRFVCRIIGQAVGRFVRFIVLIRFARLEHFHVQRDVVAVVGLDHGDIALEAAVIGQSAKGTGPLGQSVAGRGVGVGAGLEVQGHRVVALLAAAQPGKGDTDVVEVQDLDHPGENFLLGAALGRSLFQGGGEVTVRFHRNIAVQTVQQVNNHLG